MSLHWHLVWLFVMLIGCDFLGPYPWVNIQKAFCSLAGGGNGWVVLEGAGKRAWRWTREILGCRLSPTKPWVVEPGRDPAPRLRGPMEGDVQIRHILYPSLSSAGQAALKQQEQCPEARCSHPDDSLILSVLRPTLMWKKRSVSTINS